MDLPDTYGDRVFVSKSRGWQPAAVEFLDATREAWEGLPDGWHDHGPQVLRWAVLHDKFSRAGQASVSAELRRLEAHIVMMVDAAREARIEAIRAAADGTVDDPADHAELDAVLDQILNGG